MSDLQALLATGEPVILGVLNVTPDSFSDGGQFLSASAAVAQMKRLFLEGAHLVDIGGESTAPGSRKVSLEEEWRRISPCLEAALADSHTTPAAKGISGSISVDTYKSAIAARALQAGAVVINDVSALRADPGMAEVIAAHNAFVLLMHSKEDGAHPHASSSERHYKDVVQEIAEFLLERANFAVSRGVSEHKIILDPGMGRFVSHEPKYSWELLLRFDELCRRLEPFPVCVATSRKGFLGGELVDRDAASQITATFALNLGARVARTHCPKQLLDVYARQRRGVAN